MPSDFRPDATDGLIRKTNGAGRDAGSAEPGWLRRLLPASVAFLALIAFVAVVWYAYNWGRGSVDVAELPVIRAETTPEKERPVNEGGLEVPYRDTMVMNEDGSRDARIEHLLPPPEVPLPVETHIADGIGGLIRNNDISVDSLPSFVKTAQAEESSVAVLNDAVSDDISPEIVTVAEIEAAETSRTGVQLATHVPEEGQYMLQLASVTSQADAEQGWAAIKAKHQGILGNLGLTVQQAEVNGTNYFRIQTGPFPNQATASDLCAQLQAQGQDCLVRKK